MNSLEYTKQLVQFASPSRVSNAAVSDYVEETLANIGFETERVEFDDAAGIRKVNIIGKKGEGVGGIAYFGHTDVVFADDWFTTEHGPFVPTIVEDRLYGRGSCDMKGSVACMLAAAEQFSVQQLKYPIYITCTADEEVGYGGAKQVVARSKYYSEMVAGNSNGIIGEPTMLEVVHAHKGTYGFRAISRGKAAHSSTKEGLNANLAMIPFLTEIKAIYDETESDPAWQNDAFSPNTITMNIGINDHTPTLNVTPPQSICTVYFRPMPGRDGHELIERVRKIAEACGVEFGFDVGADPLYVDPKSPFVKNVLSLAGKTKPRTVAYGTDGAIFSALKNKVVFGPGSIDQAHKIDEYITLDQLKQGTEKYARLIQHWCADG